MPKTGVNKMKWIKLENDTYINIDNCVVVSREEYKYTSNNLVRSSNRWRLWLQTSSGASHYMDDEDGSKYDSIVRYINA
jgi:hypothetical protein